MNPAVLSELIALRPKPQSSTVKYVVGGALLLTAGIMGFKWYKKRKENTANADVAKNPAANSAQLLRGFMNPSGMSLLRNTDGTKTTEILSEARNIADLAAVQKYYRSMFSDADLLEDLRQELNAADYSRFLELVKSNKVVVGKDGIKIVDKAAQVYDLFFLANKQTGLYTSTAKILWSRQTVAPFSYLGVGMKNTEVSKNTIKDTSTPVSSLFGDLYYRTNQQVNGVWKTIFLKKNDWDLVARATLTKGIASKKYNQIKIDGTKF